MGAVEPQDGDLFSVGKFTDGSREEQALGTKDGVTGSERYLAETHPMGGGAAAPMQPSPREKKAQKSLDVTK